MTKKYELSAMMVDSASVDASALPRGATNANLQRANKNKKDEFYTQLSDIENEMKYYKDHFKNKVIYCNCDDPKISRFFKYFANRFKPLGLKKIIATCYKNKNIDIFSKHDSNQSAWFEYTHEGGINKKLLKGDGDFRSSECIELLEQADIVITNPPFSLFREYVGQLVQYKKKFIIVGHQNAITYKEIFKLIKENNIWLGYGFKGGAGHFINKHYEDYASAVNHKEGMIRVSGVVWFTNLNIKKRNMPLILSNKYNEKDYLKYDNYDAINVGKTKDIPVDYKGVMGVPITFMDKYNPDQFEIVKFRKGDDDKDLVINGKYPYFRILIKNKQL